MNSEFIANACEWTNAVMVCVRRLKRDVRIVTTLKGTPNQHDLVFKRPSLPRNYLMVGTMVGIRNLFLLVIVLIDKIVPPTGTISERSAKLAELYELEMLGRELGLISEGMVGRKTAK